MQDRGRFIVLDGVDGCGKSTQAAELARALENERARRVLHVREPGSTALGEALRGLLLERGSELSPAVEALLLVAARRQLLDERVGPALARGEDVVCERFHPSTYAYQAVAGGLPEEQVLALLTTWAGDPAPDLVVLLDLPPERAAARRGAPTDRIEDRGPAFQARVAEGYRRYAARTRRVAVVAADGERAQVAARVLAEVRRVL
jgi:dTMP kinase